MCQVRHGGFKVLLVGITDHYGVLSSVQTRVSCALEQASQLLCFSDGLSVLIWVCVSLVELLKELLWWVILCSSIPTKVLHCGISLGDHSGGE